MRGGTGTPVMPASEGGPGRPPRNHRCGLRSWGLELCEAHRDPPFFPRAASPPSRACPPRFPEPAPRGVQRAWASLSVLRLQSVGGAGSPWDQVPRGHPGCLGMRHILRHSRRWGRSPEGTPGVLSQIRAAEESRPPLKAQCEQWGPVRAPHSSEQKRVGRVGGTCSRGSAGAGGPRS